MVLTKEADSVVVTEEVNGTSIINQDMVAMISMVVVVMGKQVQDMKEKKKTCAIMPWDLIQTTIVTHQLDTKVKKSDTEIVLQWV